MSNQNYTVFREKGVPVKAWVNGVELEQPAHRQLMNIAQMPFIFKHIAVMPDVHMGIGATVGSVIPTKGAIIPAAVGVDIGCGMIAVRTSLSADNLPDNLSDLRISIENAVPHGGPGTRGTWAEPGRYGPPQSVGALFRIGLDDGYKRIVAKHPKINGKNDTNLNQLGTLGGGNHFIEICLDEDNNVWVMLHSGSRGVGNRIGEYFIELARNDMRVHFINLPDRDLAYLSEGTEHFNDYWDALTWAQKYAQTNRMVMMNNVLRALSSWASVPFQVIEEAVNCHHNYASRETHFGESVFITRKGAVNAEAGKMGIIPGNMGDKSYIVRGLGNPESFNSASHGAGRRMSRSEAKKRFTVEDHIRWTEGVECRKDAGVIDETKGAYKDIDAVIEAERDLVEVVHTLKQIVCVKG
jgi:tRNA-splicing ligase RtcB